MGLKHVLVKWNPSGNFEKFTIESHSKIILDNGSVWWGKISKSGNLGIDKKDFLKIEKQISNNQNTYLFMYCPDSCVPTLHVSLIKEISSIRPAENHLIPPYYSMLGYKIPFWFKIDDIRKISLEHLSHLYYPGAGVFDPVSSNAYPLLLEMPKGINFFNPIETHNSKWIDLQILYSTRHHIEEIDNNFIFVLMPFSDEFSNVWSLAIKPTVEKLGYKCQRADDFFHTKHIMDVVRENIKKARYLIADMTTLNANVFYELGYAHSLNKNVVLLTQKRDSVPFDLISIKNIEYNQNLLTELMSDLEKAIIDITRS